MYCGPKCLKHIYPDKTLEELAELCGTTFGGTSIYKMADTINRLGDSSFLYINSSLDLLVKELEKERNVIILYQNHYCIVTKVDKEKIYLYDPTFNTVLDFEREFFLTKWKNESNKDERIYISII